MSAIIAIDIGGTQLRVAVYPRNSTTPIKIQRVPSRVWKTAYSTG